MESMEWKAVAHKAFLFLGLLGFLCSNGAMAESKNKEDPAPVEDMVLIPGGEFRFGEIDTFKIVNVDSFYIDKYEVTQKKFGAVMKKDSSKFKNDNNPVEKVTWFKARRYCKKVGKRLPKEAEWEKAAKGGSDSLYHWGDEMRSGRANFCDKNCDEHFKNFEIDDGYKNTAPVGSFPPNGYGLYDMAGNVSEWVEDSYGRRKTLRGGSWKSFDFFMRPSHRASIAPYRRFDHAGFRCAK